MAERDGTKLVPISAEIEGDLRDDMQALAKAGDRSFSAEVRRGLRFYVLSSKRVDTVIEFPGSGPVVFTDGK
jgi:hypothetical protein